MSRLIKNDRIVDDAWTRLVLTEGEAPESVALPNASVIFPLVVWQAQRAAILARPHEVGVWLDSHEGAETLAGDLAHLSVIAVNFPKFTDGRGYTTARLLRERYAYRGEIRAIGDVLRDQLQNLRRCGFDAFAVREGRDLEGALRGFADFSEHYQTAVTEPQPLFRRRADAGERA